MTNQRYDGLPVWGVSWLVRPVIVQNTEDPNKAVVSTATRHTGDRFIRDGLTRVEAEALAKLLNAGEEHGK